MIDAKKLYPNFIKNGAYDYMPIVDSFGYAAIKVDEDSYQGDTWILYDNDDKIGYLVFGWGSCSYCDALQGCETIEEVQELCDELENSIVWFDTAEDALEWFIKHDWEGEWFGNIIEGQLFIQEAIDYLRVKAKQNAHDLIKKINKKEDEE